MSGIDFFFFFSPFSLFPRVLNKEAGKLYSVNLMLFLAYGLPQWLKMMVNIKSEQK